jgi:hypothetical protein
VNQHRNITLKQLRSEEADLLRQLPSPADLMIPVGISVKCAHEMLAKLFFTIFWLFLVAATAVGQQTATIITINQGYIMSIVPNSNGEEDSIPNPNSGETPPKAEALTTSPPDNSKPVSPGSSPTVPPTPMITRTGRDLMEQVAREGKILGLSQAGIEKALDACPECLAKAGYGLDQPLDSSLPLRMEQAKAAPVEFRTKLARAYRAIFGHFPKVLGSFIHAARMTHATLALASGATVDKIRLLLADPHGGVTGMSPAQAVDMDRALAAQDEITAAYAALSQDAAYETEPSIIDHLLGHKPLGYRFLDYRQKAGYSPIAVQRELQSRWKIKLYSAELNRWEINLYRPSAKKGNVITALDTLYGAKGELLAFWQSEQPVQWQNNYAKPFAKWPLRVQAQAKRLVAYKTRNPEGFPEPKHPKRWSKETEAAFLEHCGQFFGFLVTTKVCKLDDLSLTLLCDWSLEYDFFGWLKTQVNRDHYTTYESAWASTIHHLCRWYFPHLAKDAAPEQYWQDRLPTEAKVPVKTARGVIRHKLRALEIWQERWCHYVAKTCTKSAKFRKCNSFERTPYLDRVRLFLRSGIGRAKIIAELIRRIHNLPPRILSRKAAIQCRRLAEVVLLLCWNLRPGTFGVLKLDQVTIDHLVVSLSISEAQLRNRGMEGAKDGLHGPLPKYAAFHEVLRRYVQEARPILLGDPSLRANIDAGYLFIDAFSKRRGLLQTALPAGGRINEKSFYHDIVLTLGCNPWAERYLTAAEGWRQGLSDDQIGALTQTTAATAKKTFGEVRGPEKTQQANASVARMYSKNRKKK